MKKVQGYFGSEGQNGVLDAWLLDYAGRASPGDLFCSAKPEVAAHWHALLHQIAHSGPQELSALQDRVSRQALELGMAFRLTGEREERDWAISPIPLLIGAGEWSHIEQGLTQRAELLEQVIADIYGPQRLISAGHLPAVVVSGSNHFWRKMKGVPPPGGHHLRVYAADLGRGPNGNWRVLSDRVRVPAGAGYALENRLAFARATGDLLGDLNVRRLAPFFSDLRQGLAVDCERSEPRIGLLTPGRLNQSYAEQAHLARYLGFLLVEGEDLVVSENRLFVRTIEGLKRIDALWRWMDTSLLDPLAFDAQSKIGVPDLFDALTKGGLVVANWPGAGVVESRTFAAFLPKLAQKMLGEDLILPNIATWWCGQQSEREYVLDHLDDMVIGAAFGDHPAGLEDGKSRLGSTLDAQQRSRLIAAMAKRPMDYAGQENVQLSTTPALADGTLAARPFTLRVFVARDEKGNWRIMPGGFARLAEHGDIRASLMGGGDSSADVCIIDKEPVAPVTLLDPEGQPHIRRISGMLPSKAADNLFWLGRYLERAEMTSRVIRVLLGGSIEFERGFALNSLTMQHLTGLLAAWDAVPSVGHHSSIAEMCRIAFGGDAQSGSVRSLMATVRNIGEGMRDRIAVDFWRLIARQLPQPEKSQTESMLAASRKLVDRFSALSGLATENMVRGAGWHFHDLGRRIERAINGCRLIRHLAAQDSTADDLTVLLDLSDCQITYRTRYLSGPALYAVRDMVMLEPQNPRSLVYQVQLIVEHLSALPSLRKDGMPEPPIQAAREVMAMLATANAERVDVAMLQEIETRLLSLSEVIGQRYFLQVRHEEQKSKNSILA